jgi:hypothetical protein
VAGRDRRLAENQELFRKANERFEERVEEYTRDGVSAPFLCECADEECLGRVHLTLPRYQEVRQHRDRYVILAGHPTIEGERLVEDAGEFQIVQKDAKRSFLK